MWCLIGSIKNLTSTKHTFLYIHIESSLLQMHETSFNSAVFFFIAVSANFFCCRDPMKRMVLRTSYANDCETNQKKQIASNISKIVVRRLCQHSIQNTHLSVSQFSSFLFFTSLYAYQWFNECIHFVFVRHILHCRCTLFDHLDCD